MYYPFLYILIYKLACLFVGILSIRYGYSLFIKEIIGNAGNLIGKVRDYELTLTKAAPGTFFSLFGATIICITVYKGFSTKDLKEESSNNTSAQNKPYIVLDATLLEYLSRSDNDTNSIKRNSVKPKKTKPIQATQPHITYLSEIILPQNFDSASKVPLGNGVTLDVPRAIVSLLNSAKKSEEAKDYCSMYTFLVQAEQLVKLGNYSQHFDESLLSSIIFETEKKCPSSTFRRILSGTGNLQKPITDNKEATSN